MHGNTRGMGSIPSPAVRGGGHLLLTVNTFGLPARARYDMQDRQVRGSPLEELEPGELYETIRGTAHAIRLACADGNERDLKIALLRMQRAAVELTRVAAHAHVRVVEDQRDTPVHLLRSA